MINVKDLKKVYEERMDDRDRRIVNEFENFIDNQLIKSNGKSKLTESDFLAIVDKAVGGLTTEDYMAYKKAFEDVEIEIGTLGMKYVDEIYYSEEATLLKYMFKKYRDNGYFIKPSKSRFFFQPSKDKTIYIEK